MPRQKQNKVKLTLSIDKNILERAKRKIPNISAFLEIKLLEFLELRNNSKTDPAGFEPATLGLGGPRPIQARLRVLTILYNVPIYVIYGYRIEKYKFLK